MSNLQQGDQHETADLTAAVSETTSAKTPTNIETTTATTEPEHAAKIRASDVNARTAVIPTIEIEVDDSDDPKDGDKPGPNSGSDPAVPPHQPQPIITAANVQKPWSRRKKVGRAFVVLILLSPFCCLWGSPLALNWLLPKLADQIAPVQESSGHQVPNDVIHQLLENFDSLSQQHRQYFTVADMVANWHGDAAITRFVAENLPAICDPTVGTVAGTGTADTCYAITRNSLSIYASLHHLQP